MDDETFSRQIRALEHHIQELLEQAGRGSPTPEPFLAAALAELQTSLEERRVVEEELPGL